MVSAEAGTGRGHRGSLTATSGVLGLSTVASRLAILVVIALLTRSAGTVAAGYYGLATLSASFTAAGLSLGFPTYLTRDVPAKLVDRADVARIHWARLGALALAAAVAYPVAAGLLPGGFQLGFFLCFAASLLEQWNETAWVLVRGTRRAWVEAVTNGCTGLLLITACALDGWLRGGLRFLDAAVLLVLAAAVRSAVACATVGIGRPGRPTAVPLRAHVRRALPYFASDLLGLMYFRSDVFVLALFVAAAQVGEYVSAGALVGPAVQVAASMGAGALAYASRLMTTGDHTDRGSRESTASLASAQLRGTVFRFFAVSGQAAAGVMCLGLPLAATILFGRGGHAILVLSLILALFLALRFANFGLSAILLAHGRATSRLLVLVFSVTGNVALNLVFDGPFGPYGAAWATVLTELIVAGSLLAFIADRTLVRPVALAVASTGAAAAVLVGLWWVLPASQVGPVAGAVFLAIGAVWLARARSVARGMPAPVEAVSA